MTTDYATFLRERILPRVQKPARYIGGEWNQITKPSDRVQSRVLLAFPDLYEIGVAYLGFQILYELINREPDFLAERVFSPWDDFEKLLRESQTPLCSLETSTPLDRFDYVGITLQHELAYSNALNLLDLGRMPLRASDRTDHQPLVIGGGPCASNPEPLAEAFDLFVLGDGETALLDVLRLDQAQRHLPRAERLRRLSGIPGVYVPALYHPVYTAAGRLERIEADPGAPPRILRRRETPPDLPAKPVVPYLGVTHDRVSAELFRGCTRGCRFCQAGMITRPVRERDPEKVLEQLVRSVAETGYEEASLTSLSSGDYTQLLPLIRRLMQEFAPGRVALSFPSLRLDSFQKELAETVREVRKTGLTFAPEAGSARLRQVINKCLDEAGLTASLSEVFAEGWDLVKLYFMIGLPTETREDVLAIVTLVKQMLSAARTASAGRGRSPRIHLSVNLFVPKPHTPFQWEPQLAREEALARFQLLARQLPKAAGFRFGRQEEQGLEQITIESLLARGDRRLFPVLLRVQALGARFDSWGDQFRPDLWHQALQQEGLDAEAITTRAWNTDDVLPWSHLDMGVSQAYLQAERGRAQRGEATPDCRQQDACNACGVLSPAECPLPAAPGMALPPAKPLVLVRPEREAVRLRFRYCKTGDMRFLGHLDMINLFRRAARRARLPLHYSLGFHPQPALSFGPPLPLGFAGLGEWMDIGLDRWEDPQLAMAALNRVLPAGLQVETGQEIPLSASALNEEITAGEYTAVWTVSPKQREAQEAHLRAFLAASEVSGPQWSKKGTVWVNLRPAIHRLAWEDSGQGEIRLRFTHRVLAQGSVKVPALLEYWSAAFAPVWSIKTTRIASGRWVQEKILAP